MAQVIFAGIDISALKCDLVCLDEQGHQLAPVKSFPNSLEGASAMVEVLDGLARKFNIQQLHIGLEATSVYSVHLHQFLLDSPKLKPYSTKVYEINPVMVAGFKKVFGAKSPKTDALDAYVIAERVRFGHLTPYSREAIVTEPLRHATTWSRPPTRCGCTTRSIRPTIKASIARLPSISISERWF